MAYLSDADFLVGLTGASSLVETISRALRAPVYALSLGRRCCVPTERVFADLVESDDVVKVLRCAPRDASAQPERLPIWLEGPEGALCGYMSYQPNRGHAMSQTNRLRPLWMHPVLDVY